MHKEFDNFFLGSEVIACVHLKFNHKFDKILMKLYQIIIISQMK